MVRQGVRVSKRSVKFQGLFVPRKIQVQHVLYQKNIFSNELCFLCESCLLQASDMTQDHFLIFAHSKCNATNTDPACQLKTPEYFEANNILL